MGREGRGNDGRKKWRERRVQEGGKNGRNRGKEKGGNYEIKEDRREEVRCFYYFCFWVTTRVAQGLLVALY